METPWSGDHGDNMEITAMGCGDHVVTMGMMGTMWAEHLDHGDNGDVGTMKSLKMQ